MNTGDRTYGNAVGVIPDPETVGISVAVWGDVLDNEKNEGGDEGANDAETSNVSPVTRSDMKSGSSTPTSANL